ncbi:MAG: rhomboid family intramembrane serine protease [Bacillota bacterium]
MTIKPIALLTKHLIEEKEFFLYPLKSIESVFDILLHKQNWFYEYFLSFMDGDSFLNSTLDRQINRLHQTIHAIEMNNRFKKLFHYRILVFRDPTVYDHNLHQLNQLYEWLKSKNIRIQLLAFYPSVNKVVPLYASFQDTERIIPFIEDYSLIVAEEEMDEIDLLEVEHQTKKAKGYYLEKKKYHVTTLIAAINILYWLFMSYHGSTTDTYTLIQFGAKYNPLVAAGEYYRLFTSMFIHIGLPHLLLNSYALTMLGKDIEAIYGSKKFIFIYIIAGLFGSLGSFLFSTAVSAGASGAILGLMGAYLYFGIRRPIIFSARYGLNLVSLLVINVAFGLANTNIDNYAHLGGLMGGFLISWAIGLKNEKMFRPSAIRKSIIVVILLLLLLFTGVRIHQATWEYHLHEGFQSLQEENLETARIHFEKGLKINQQIPDLYFYLGYIYYLEGDQNMAIKYLEQALALNPDDSMAKELLETIKQGQ